MLLHSAQQSKKRGKQNKKTLKCCFNLCSVLHSSVFHDTTVPIPMKPILILWGYDPTLLWDPTTHQRGFWVSMRSKLCCVVCVSLEHLHLPPTDFHPMVSGGGGQGSRQLPPQGYENSLSSKNPAWVNEARGIKKKTSLLSHWHCFSESVKWMELGLIEFSTCMSLDPQSTLCIRLIEA